MITTEILEITAANPSVFIPGSEVSMTSEGSETDQNLQPSRHAFLGPAGNPNYLSFIHFLNLQDLYAFHETQLPILQLNSLKIFFKKWS